jgi:hypothetical protein
MGKVVVMTKFGDTISSNEVFDAGTPHIPGFNKAKVFEF